MSYIQNPDTKNKQKYLKIGYSSFSHTGSAGTSPKQHEQQA